MCLSAILAVDVKKTVTENSLSLLRRLLKYNLLEASGQYI